MASRWAVSSAGTRNTFGAVTVGMPAAGVFATLTAPLTRISNECDACTLQVEPVLVLVLRVSSSVKPALEVCVFDAVVNIFAVLSYDSTTA